MSDSSRVTNLRNAPPTEAARGRPWGVGFTYRAVIDEQVMGALALVDFLELPAEDYVDPRRRHSIDPGEHLAARMAEHRPVVAHGNGMSLGSAEGIDPDYLDRAASWVRRTPVASYSEHLSFTRAGGRDVDCFVSIPWTDAGVAAAVANIRWVRARLGVPVLVENVSHHFVIPGSTMGEAAFLSRVATEADCGIMLDVANLHINASNHGYDPVAYLAALPADRVQQAHFCGATRQDRTLLDTHFERTDEAIWSLLERALRTTALGAVILERDSHFDPFAEVEDELRRARELWARAGKSKPEGFDAPVQWAPSEPEPETGATDALARMQAGLLEMLCDAELSAAVGREGAAALAGRGLDDEARTWLASIPGPALDRLGVPIRRKLRKEALRREVRRKAELRAWGRQGR